ncbi:MAG: rhodanese-like domain-containing protein [Thiotrichales bacterium]|nr:MAG: rhodanese-like domain-containing protein [Thiotrichales bacterium]
MKNSIVFCVLMCASSISVSAQAANVEVKITEENAHAMVNHGDELIKAERIQDTSDTIDGAFAGTSGPCPPFCVKPQNIEQGVATVAELEVIRFTETALHSGKGLLVDVRAPGSYRKETIPGSTNIPFTEFEKPANDPDLVVLLQRLGAKQRSDVNVVMRSLEKAGLFDGEDKTDNWDFSEVKSLLLWCDGPWCEQSPRAISALISMGYPADKLYYYRGGMQMWQSLGLSTVVPTDLSTFASN